MDSLEGEDLKEFDEKIVKLLNKEPKFKKVFNCASDLKEIMVFSIVLLHLLLGCQIFQPRTDNSIILPNWPFIYTMQKLLYNNQPCKI